MDAKPGRILLTGAGGFIGRATLAALDCHGFDVRAVFRSHGYQSAGRVQWVRGDLMVADGWDRILDGIDVVLHLAGNPGHGTADEMMRMNAGATAMLARAAVAAGVSRFVYAGTARVYGCQPHIDAATLPAPQDAYGRSKQAAETALENETRSSGGPALSIIRPPFVHGADRAGLLKLLVLAARYRLPLPLACLTNRRSLIHVANLADLFAKAAAEPKERGSYSLPAGEGLDLTYGELYQQIGKAMGRRGLIFPFPVGLLRLFARGVLPREAAARLFEECVIDGSSLAQRLGWKPPVPVDKAIAVIISRAIPAKV